MKKIIMFFKVWGLAREIIQNRTRVFEKTDFGTDERGEAITEYRKIWPKTPYICCDDAHEAGFVHGYFLGKNKK